MACTWRSSVLAALAAAQAHLAAQTLNRLGLKASVAASSGAPDDGHTATIGPLAQRVLVHVQAARRLVQVQQPAVLLWHSHLLPPSRTGYQIVCESRVFSIFLVSRRCRRCHASRATTYNRSVTV